MHLFLVGAHYCIRGAVAQSGSRCAECYHLLLPGSGQGEGGDVNGALADYNQSIQIYPTAPAYYNRAIIKQKRGDINGALADYTHAIALNPRYYAAYENRGNAKFSRGDRNGALADYNRALALNPKDPVAYNDRGRVREVTGDLNGAMAD
jgi:tetratricopeptide (TPR) repeat protein